MVAKLHYITDTISGKSHAVLAEQACKGGADWVQLRVKNQPEEIIEKWALETQEVCKKYKARLIINDHVAIAKKIGADGVHLGKTDENPEKARLFLGNDMIIGGTANTLEDIEKLARFKVDYIGLGPFRFTKTKENLSPILGLEGFKEITNQCKSLGIDIPIIAIGGIKPDDIKSLLGTGVHGVAVSSVINLSENPVATTQELTKKLI
ncbi:thiamine phosphate synthase [Flexithrix dorotheae]|uniref:thiamine phosphate synthase n=1 Tax=Flexithrix dorotheae TaxID=70993 RepID=UPI0003A536E5|nr:thiamine phosphate synthase [Flexithrix dorotheae]